MRQKPSANEPATTIYSGDTYPLMPQTTESLFLRDSSYVPVPSPSGFQRFLHGIHLFLQALVRKINRLLAFGLALLLLLLFTRFLLHFFGISGSLFAQWAYQISNPPVYPFQGLMPPLPYNGYSIDVSTLVAIVVYALLVKTVTSFLSILVE